MTTAEEVAGVTPPSDEEVLLATEEEVLVFPAEVVSLVGVTTLVQAEILVTLVVTAEELLFLLVCGTS